MIAAGFPIVSHPSRAVLRDYPRNLLSTGRGIAGGRVPGSDIARVGSATVKTVELIFCTARSCEHAPWQLPLCVTKQETGHGRMPRLASPSHARSRKLGVCGNADRTWPMVSSG
jgi:hypothetical protein